MVPQDLGRSCTLRTWPELRAQKAPKRTLNHSSFPALGWGVVEPGKRLWLNPCVSFHRDSRDFWKAAGRTGVSRGPSWEKLKTVVGSN